jgi:Ca2+-binding EF-hand superfamily protein
MFRVLSLPAIAALSAAILLSPATAQAGNPKKKADKLEILFKKLDTNNDGKLSIGEFAKLGELKKKATETAKKPAKAGKKTDQLFKKLDTDNDGFLSLAEFRKLKEAKEKKAK